MEIPVRHFGLISDAFDMRRHFEVELILNERHVETETGIEPCLDKFHLITENMFPMHRLKMVSPPHTGLRIVVYLGQRSIITPEIEVGPYLVVVSRSKEPCHIVVPEIIPYRRAVEFEPALVKKVQIRLPRRYEQSSLLAERNLQGTLSGHDSHIHFPADLVRHLGRQFHTYHAAYHIGILRAGRSGKGHFGKMRRIEHGEEAEKVAYPVKGHTGYGHVVVGVVATLYIDARIEFRIGLHSGKRLEIPQRVRVPENLRKSVYHVEVDIYFRQHRPPHRGGRPFVNDCGPIDFENYGITVQNIALRTVAFGTVGNNLNAMRHRSRRTIKHSP